VDPEQNRDADDDRVEAVASRSAAPRRQTLNASVRRRRADRAFYLRLAGAMRQNERALERLKR
jgi:hypothetical protein